MLPYHQVNVFSSNPVKGNPLGVVSCNEQLSDKQMQEFAKWTNLSETTFLFPPKNPKADYLVRIWTPTLEMKFAGHPTLGTAHVWALENGEKDEIVQECGIGLVSIKKIDGKLAFKAPDCSQSELDSASYDQILSATGLTRDDVIDAVVLDNGPQFQVLRLKDPSKLLNVTPNWSQFPDIFMCGLCAVRDDGVLVVRALVVDESVEDPICGSLNAALAQWLLNTNIYKDSYVVSQGHAIGFDGRVEVKKQDDGIWIAGDVQTVIKGTVDL